MYQTKAMYFGMNTNEHWVLEQPLYSENVIYV